MGNRGCRREYVATSKINLKPTHLTMDPSQALLWPRKSQETAVARLKMEPQSSCQIKNACDVSLIIEAQNEGKSITNEVVR